MLKKTVIFFLIAFLFASSCSAPVNGPVEAMQRIQELAGFPTSDLIYIEITTMINSPQGDLQVELYQDEEGRKFYVESATNTVVEIDARDLLGLGHSGGEIGDQVFTQAELEDRAEEFVRAAVPEFPSLQGDLDYEAGGKADNFFFTWRLRTNEIYFMPPFIQVGMTNRGEVFAYYNTVTTR